MKTLTLLLMTVSTLLAFQTHQALAQGQLYQSSTLLCWSEKDVFRILDVHEKQGMNAAFDLAERTQDCSVGYVQYMPIEEVRIYRGLPDIHGVVADVRVWRVFLPYLRRVGYIVIPTPTEGRDI